MPVPRRGAEVSRRPRRGTSDLLNRVLVAIPAVAFAVLIIWQGEWVFAAGIAALGVICVHELTVMLERARPVRLAAMLGVVGLTVAGTAGDERQVLMALEDAPRFLDAHRLLLELTTRRESPEVEATLPDFGSTPTPRSASP